jgi:hypothetical protein
LTTRGQTFVKGESFNFETSFNIYRLGAKYDFEYFSPKAELVLMNFDYELWASGERVNRSYTKPALRLGAEKIFKIDEFDIIFEASGSMPIPNTPDIYTVAAGVKYWITEYFNVGLGAQYFYLNYQDNQELDNHLRLEMLPAITFSVQYRF